MMQDELYACNGSLYDRTTMYQIRTEESGFDVLWNQENAAMRCSLINSRYIQDKYHRLIGKDVVDFNGNLLRAFVERNRIALRGVFKLEEGEIQGEVLRIYVLLFLADAVRDFVNNKEISQDKFLHLAELSDPKCTNGLAYLKENDVE